MARTTGPDTHRVNRYSQNRNQPLLNGQAAGLMNMAASRWIEQYVPDMPTHSVGNAFSLLEEWCAIRDVWQSNLEEEFRTIQGIVDEYPIIALKVVTGETGHRPVRIPYHQMRQKVVTHSMLQLGMTFMDTSGRLRPGTAVWQFNFRPARIRNGFTTNHTHQSHNSSVAQIQGIDVSEFAELLTASGIVLNRNVTCVSFNAVLDFGHLIQMLTGGPLPDSEQQFQEQLSLYFPVTYDIKYLSKSVRTLTASDLRSVS
jgi:CCR4-NOT transcription complex subunit 7/8